jgi:large subunit ribosomal protein L16
MLSPKRVKYRKRQRGECHAVAHSGNQLAFGEYGLMATEPMWITNRQIEAARVALARHIKRGGKIWIRIYPDMPYTKKPAETRQGNGKGNPEGWVAVVKTGAIMFEMGGIDKAVAQEALTLAASKLPIHTKFVMRRDME